jgi:hypothetical protein
MTAIEMWGRMMIAVVRHAIPYGDVDHGKDFVDSAELLLNEALRQDALVPITADPEPDEPESEQLMTGRPKKDRPQLECVFCHELFTPGRAKVKFCSMRCAGKASYAARKARGDVPKPPKNGAPKIDESTPLNLARRTRLTPDKRLNVLESALTAKRTGERGLIECPDCGEGFLRVSDDGQVICSAACPPAVKLAGTHT